jgi:predicted GIY-YIG superfamily endonuclease
MKRIFWNTIYIDRDPHDPYKGWGWIQITTEDCKRVGVPIGNPETYERFRQLPSERLKLPNNGNLPSRGKAGAKKFTLNCNGEMISLRVQKSLTIEAICAWLKTWAHPDTQIITPGNRSHSLEGQKVGHQAHFVYFIMNEDSNAIKIGYAKDLAKRIKALQTSSPAALKLIKSVQVEGSTEAQSLEQSLHRQFHDIRITGEWFKADATLLEYIGQL